MRPPGCLVRHIAVAHPAQLTMHAAARCKAKGMLDCSQEGELPIQALYNDAAHAVNLAQSYTCQQRWTHQRTHMQYSRTTTQYWSATVLSDSCRAMPRLVYGTQRSPHGKAPWPRARATSRAAAAVHTCQQLARPVLLAQPLPHRMLRLCTSCPARI